MRNAPLSGELHWGEPSLTVAPIKCTTPAPLHSPLQSPLHPLLHSLLHYAAPNEPCTGKQSERQQSTRVSIQKLGGTHYIALDVEMCPF